MPSAVASSMHVPVLRVVMVEMPVMSTRAVVLCGGACTKDKRLSGCKPTTMPAQGCLFNAGSALRLSYLWFWPKCKVIGCQLAVHFLPGVEELVGPSLEPPLQQWRGRWR